MGGAGSSLIPYAAPAGHDTAWAPQRGTQTALVTCPCTEVCYGGAAGGGKTDGLLGDYAAGIEEWGRHRRGIIIRRTFPELDEVEQRALEIFSPHYGEKAYRRGEKKWYFKTAKGTATLKLQAIQDDVDVIKIQGRAWNWAAIDEAGHFPTDKVLEYLRTRLRSAAGAPVYVRLTANPGGVGHDWIVDRYRINTNPPLVPFEVDTDEGETESRVFIPSLVTDNKLLMANDPSYARTLAAISDPLLRRALRYGDWTVAMGAAFSEFDRRVHVVPHRAPPQGVRVWRAMDWGFDKPTACYWFYVDFDGFLNIFHELYTCGAKPNTGLRINAPDILTRIQNIEAGYGISVKTAYLDPACWQEHSGDSIFKQLGGYKAHWSKWPTGPNWRQNKKQMLHELLKVVNGVSRVKVHDNCVHFIRTISSLQTDPRDTTDINSKGEDHGYDAVCGGIWRIVNTPKRARFDPIRDSFFEDNHPGELVGPGRYGAW